MAINLVYVANTNVLELQGLKSAIEDAFITDASVSVTVQDQNGSNVSGQTWPAALAYVAETDATYRTILKDGLQLTPGGSYVALIDANCGVDRIGHWKFPFRAADRTK